MYTSKNVNALLPIAPVDNATVTVSNIWPISAAPNTTYGNRFLTIQDNTGYEYILFASNNNKYAIDTAVTLRNGQPYVSQLKTLGPTMYYYTSTFVVSKFACYTGGDKTNTFADAANIVTQNASYSVPNLYTQTVKSISNDQYAFATPVKMSDGSVFNIGGYTSSLSLSDIILKYYYN